MTAVEEIYSRCAALVKLPQSATVMNVSSNGLYMAKLLSVAKI
jgi:hypothetical protein